MDMYFFDLGLTPFEAGKQVGSSDLVKKNRFFFSSEDSQKIPQGILEEKKAFAAKCEKICRTVYPSILEEMEGFCSSSGIAMEEWSTRFFYYLCLSAISGLHLPCSRWGKRVPCKKQRFFAAGSFFMQQLCF